MTTTADLAAEDTGDVERLWCCSDGERLWRISALAGQRAALPLLPAGEHGPAPVEKPVPSPRLDLAAHAKLDAANAEVAELTERSPMDGVADTERPSETFRALPVEGQRAVVGRLMRVTIHPATRKGPLPARERVDLDRLDIVLLGVPPG
jgi:hypothetical protein